MGCAAGKQADNVAAPEKTGGTPKKGEEDKELPSAMKAPSNPNSKAEAASGEADKPPNIALPTKGETPQVRNSANLSAPGSARPSRTGRRSLKTEGEKGEKRGHRHSHRTNRSRPNSGRPGSGKNTRRRKQSGRDMFPDDGGSRRRSLVRRPSHTGLLNALALQFPVISGSFQAVFQAFQEYHTKGSGLKEVITLDKLGAVLEHVGEKKKFSEEEIKELFKLSDLDGSKEITFREFLIAVAMGYFLKVESDNEEFIRVARGFKVVQKAFNDMDADKGGSIDISELKKALFATAASDNKDVLEERFRELDFNGDGDIFLPEFLFGMVSWVGFADEMDEDE